MTPTEEHMCKARAIYESLECQGNDVLFADEVETDLTRIATALAAAEARGREQAAKAAEGSIFKERYRGTEDFNWHPNSEYGRGRCDAAAAIRALGESRT